MKPGKNVYPNDICFMPVGHRLEVLNFLAKRKEGDERREEREREGEKVMYQIHYVLKIKRKTSNEITTLYPNDPE